MFLQRRSISTCVHFATSSIWQIFFHILSEFNQKCDRNNDSWIGWFGREGPAFVADVSLHGKKISKIQGKVFQQ